MFRHVRVANVNRDSELPRMSATEDPPYQPASTADAALAKTRARLQAFLSHAPEAIFIKDAQGRYVEVSIAFLQLAGKPIEEVIGKTDEDIFDAAIAAKFADEDRRVRESGEPLLFEETFPYQGESFTFLTQKFPLPDGEVAGIATNVTARKAQQEAHDRLAERLRVAIEGTGIGFYENNFTTGESVWSESAFRVLGLEPAAGLQGGYELWSSRVHPEDLERVLAEHQAAVERGGAWSVQYRVLGAHGEDVRWVLAHTQFTQREDGLWPQDAYTGGGFPRVFYLRYHGYRAFFPLWALARYRRLSVANSRRVPFGL
jgi:PAS domain S-box-containing protein